MHTLTLILEEWMLIPVGDVSGQEGQSLVSQTESTNTGRNER